MPGIRTFIALPAPSPARKTIQLQLKATQAPVKWESQDKFHITLFFLGNVEQSKNKILSTALAESVQPFHSLEILYECAFPNIHVPRVVWIGIRTNPAVLDLQAEVQRVCGEFGFPKEERAFHPHITLGRLKEAHKVVRLTEAIKTITFEPIETHCSEILLMKSELHPGGSRYTILKSFPLHT